MSGAPCPPEGRGSGQSSGTSRDVECQGQRDGRQRLASSGDCQGGRSTWRTDTAQWGCGGGRAREVQGEAGLAHLNALDAEAERGTGADAFSPLHVARLSDRALRVLLLGGCRRVYGQHLLVHVLPQLGPLAGFGQLLFQVSPTEAQTAAGLEQAHTRTL